MTAILAALADLLDAFEATMARLAALAIALLWLCKKLPAITPLKKILVLCPVGGRPVTKKV